MKAKKLKYRLGLDIGTNSIGWAVLGLDAKQDIGIGEVVDAGVRIFSDGRKESTTKTTLAAERRAARGARRRRDHFLMRQQHLIVTMTETGLFPEDKVQRQSLQRLNPLELRARALTEELTPFEIGRALFHINQRRGFKSNRKDKSKEKTNGAVATSVRNLLVEMGMLDKANQTETSGAGLAKLQENPRLTFGSFLWERYQKNEPTRARPGLGEDGKLLYDVYPMREIYIDEFNKIWDKQAEYHPEVMLPELRATIYGIIFSQRNLKPPRVGMCIYMRERNRTYRAMPSFQRYRIYQEVNNLEWRDECNQWHKIRDNKEARDVIVGMLEKQAHKSKPQKPSSRAEVSFKEIKKELDKRKIIDNITSFNLGTELREGLNVNLTSIYMQHPDYVGAQWHDWSLERQDAFVEIILNHALDDKEVHQKLQQDFGLSEQQAKQCADASLLDGTASVSLKAAGLLLKKMESEVTDEHRKVIFLMQHEAVEALATERKDFINPARRPKSEEGEFIPRAQLPYYGKAFCDGRHIIPGSRDLEDKKKGDNLKYYGGVTNPTVHIALNQIRKVVNELITRYGHPTSIAIELGRELPKGVEYRSNLTTQQKKNQDKNKVLSEKLEELGQKDNRENRLRLKLWQEQKQICPYSGNKIGYALLFSSDVEVDHIIPFSQSLDDSAANKVVCTLKSDQYKRNRTPWQAFSGSRDGYNWDDIVKRASEIEVSALQFDSDQKRWVEKKFNNKQWRFEKDALKKLQTEHGDGFLARHLNDTRYIGRLAKEYLEYICHIDQIDVLTGRLTSLLRGHWGLNGILQSNDSAGKNREDHRHHAVDAIVIGMTNKKILSKIHTEAKREEELSHSRLFVRNDDGTSPIDPWQGFRAQVQSVVNAIKVSHRVNHKKKGQLLLDSAYGIADKQEREALNQVQHDKAITTAVVIRKELSWFNTAERIEKIRNATLRNQFMQRFEAAENLKESIESVHQLANELKIRTLRVKVNKTIRPILDKKGRVYKGYELQNNWAVEIYQLPASEKWKGVTVRMFDAAQKKFQPGVTHRPHPAAKLIMRLFKEDMLLIVDQFGVEKLMRVHKMREDGRVYICEHQLANVAKRLTDLKNSNLCYEWSASNLQKFQARKVNISPTGQVCRAK